MFHIKAYPFISIALSLFGAIFLKGVLIMKNKSENAKSLQRLTLAAVLSALSLVLMATIRFPIFPSAPFYEMEFSDVPILVCSGLLGPVYSTVSLFIVCLIQTLFFSSSSGFIGFVMHFVSSSLMIIVVYLIRKAVKGFRGIILSDICGVIVMTLVMIPMNMWLVSEFMNIDAKGFIDGFLWVCVGFNLIKATANVTIYTLLAPEKLFKKLFKGE